MTNEPSFRILEAIGKLRFSFTVVADLLYTAVSTEGHDGLDGAAKDLVQAAQKICTDTKVNQTATGPAIFLLKQVVKQFGYTCLEKLAKSDAFSWVLPQHLNPPDTEVYQETNVFLFFCMHDSLTSITVG